MGADFRVQGGAVKLIDRRAECGVLDGLIEAVRAGESRTLVVSGEAGVARQRCSSTWSGRRRDAGWCVPRAASRRWSWRSPHCISCAPRCWTASSQYCPAARCLRIALGMASGPIPDKFLVGLAVLHRLSGAADAQPLICVVDDEHWLDRASAQCWASLLDDWWRTQLGLS